MVSFSNIIIVGPTSSGKSDLANFIATYLEAPVFNCDSVQVYKDLDYLSNKPKFIEQRIENDEVVSFTKPTQFLDFSRYKGFTFKIAYRLKDEIVRLDLNFDEVLKFLIDSELVDSVMQNNLKNVRNYLFDVRIPMEGYSVSNFTDDIRRITTKNKLNQKIIVGGTVYYAYHYMIGTSFENELQYNLGRNVSLSVDELVHYLQEHDPRSLELLDVKNIVRLNKAVDYIKETGKKYSESYLKNINLLNDFLLIAIHPKNRDEYTKNLNEIVKARINMKAFDEINSLLKKYGQEVVSWLQKISYEYKYAYLISNYISKGQKIEDVHYLLEELQAKERQYTKRQITFIRKMLETVTIG